MFKNKIDEWIQGYFYCPNKWQKFISFILLPFSLLYCFFVVLKRFFSIKKTQNIPIISIGNLIIGGSGKTPFCISLAREYEQVAIILRGYKRHTKGLVVVSLWGDIKCNVLSSGDEAMLYAKELPNALVIVSENRIEAIQKAKQKGAKVIFLDDGFSKAHIDKMDILIKPKKLPYNNFCLPSGAYREPTFFYSKADLLVEEDKDFKRKSFIKNPTSSMVLVTAIANPLRLQEHFSKTKKEFFFSDHHIFKQEELEKIIKEENATSLLVTKKDAVKLENLGLPLSIIDLELEINENVRTKIKNYIEQYI